MGANIPRHVALIMDGNGRWAQKRNKPLREGHIAGFNNIKRVVKAFYDSGVEYLTLFAFSTENWSRPDKEVESIVNFAHMFGDDELEKYHRLGIRIRHIGHVKRLNAQTRALVDKTLARTRANRRFTLCVAFDYGGRDEIVQAARSLLASGVAPERLNEDMFGERLMTADMPDPDLLIRTSGENRISNFLIWQAAYAEYYTSPKFWPDFDQNDVALALEEYSNRKRRFGGR